MYSKGTYGIENKWNTYIVYYIYLNRKKMQTNQIEEKKKYK